MSKTTPIIICGTHGGGTSFVTKMLRASGLFIGNDVEPFESRKFHESESFRMANVFIFEQLGGEVNGMSEIFINNYNKNFKNKILLKNIENKIQQNIDLILQRFSNNNDDVFNKPWGWKDPRNSPNLYFWLKFFPDAKILMIEKKEMHKKSKSGSGQWFRTSSEKQKNFYYKPSNGIDLSIYPEKKILRINFEELTSQQEKFDLMTKFCNLNKTELHKILEMCKYEK